MKMKTNRRSKRIKNARRNRRSRRTQRGGGVNEVMRHYKDMCIKNCDGYITLRPGGPDRAAFDRCIKNCDEHYPQDVPHDDLSKATANGWYVDYYISSETGDPNLQIRHASWPPLKTIYHEQKLSDPITMRIVANLDKMPDPTKTYGFDGTKWKITYDAARLALQWESQTDQSKQPFDMESPLKIGDKMATEIE